jgi:hypothetical protein
MEAMERSDIPSILSPACLEKNFALGWEAQRNVHGLTT